MRGYLVACILAVVASTAQAINVTFPTKDATIVTSSNLTVQWTSTSSDPSTIDIAIVHNSNSTQTTKTLATDISTSPGFYKVDISSVSSGSDYQINLVGTGAGNTGILAQSPKFKVETSGSPSSSSPSGTATSPHSKSASSTASSTHSASATSSHTSGADALKPLGGAGALIIAAAALI